MHLHIGTGHVFPSGNYSRPLKQISNIAILTFLLISGNSQLRYTFLMVLRGSICDSEENPGCSFDSAKFGHASP